MEGIKTSVLYAVLWIRILVGNADPDSGRKKNGPKLTNKPGFQPFKKVK
jgi:hypothetical protein